MLKIFTEIIFFLGIVITGYMIVKSYLAIIEISDSLKMIAKTLDKTLGGNKWAW